jgi:hypothetical protein
MMMMMRMMKLQDDGTCWKITDKRTQWYWMTKVRIILHSLLSANRQ